MLGLDLIGLDTVIANPTVIISNDTKSLIRKGIVEYGGNKAMNNPKRIKGSKTVKKLFTVTPFIKL